MLEKQGWSGSYALVRAVAAVLLAGALFTCRETQEPRSLTESGRSARPSLATAAPPGSVVLVGAADIALCNGTGDEATAALLDSIPGTVFAVGDNAYPNGTPTNYLNSNNSYVSTALGSPQETWLKADLAATTKKCILAMWHSPRFYSTTASSFSPTGYVKPFWDDLYAAHAQLIINGHMNDYERFAPQTSAGAADAVNGIRQFIAGTGGNNLDAANTLIIPNSEVRISKVYGVLKLTLGDGTYAWQFIPVAGQTASASARGTCYSPPPQ